MAAPDISTEIFADPARGARNLTSLHEAFILSGSRYTVEEFTRALGPGLTASPDPDMALMNLLRFSETTVSTTSLFNDLVSVPVYMELLLSVFGSSQYFSDILVREPSLFRWLVTTDAIETTLTAAYLEAEVGRILQTFQKAERRLDALKRLHRREILRIGVQDFLGTQDLAGVTRQLSELADAVVRAVCGIVTAALAEHYGELPEMPYAIIGLGKLGGNELNYSSDIDILFVYGEDGDLARGIGPAMTRQEYFNRYAERVVQLLSQPTGEGYFYRVDTRLRPEAGAGPLARSLSEYLTHYESRGEIWERQMLIKARPVAGDPELGDRFIAQLQSFVYPRTFLQNPLESVQKVKSRIEASVGDEANIKLMAGGIRDIEFIVQVLQLLNGGSNARVRERNTLRALRLLADEGLLSAAESSTLVDAYRFYRKIEHRLQTMLNTRTHTIPDNPRTLEPLARRLGLRSAEELGEVRSRHLAAVKAVFDKVFSLPEQPGGNDLATLLDAGMPDQAAMKFFAAGGFRNPRLAARNLRTFLGGSPLTGGHGHDVRAREAFDAIAPQLFGDLHRTPDPDLALSNLALLGAAQKFRHQFYVRLAERNFRTLVVQICAVSPRFVRSLARDATLLDSVGAELESPIEENAMEIAAGSDLVGFKNTAELRLGLRYVLGRVPFSRLTSGLTKIADAAVRRVLEDELRTSRLRSEPLAVFALGKYGTGEVTFDADLDILFFSSASSGATQSKLEGVAASVIQRLSAVSERGVMYDVDARLRPEGKNAPLVAHLSGYTEYLRHRASLWERQSLTRLRFIAGSPTLRDSVRAIVEEYVYRSPLPQDWVQKIVEMRRKTESRSHTRAGELVDLKLGAGGMVDIEFLAQMIQLGSACSALGGITVSELLERHPSPAIDPREASELLAAYSTFRRLETLIRLTLDERGSVLPEGEKLETLARCFDRSSGEELRRVVASTMSATREIFLAASNRLSLLPVPVR